MWKTKSVVHPLMSNGTRIRQPCPAQHGRPFPIATSHKPHLALAIRCSRKLPWCREVQQTFLWRRINSPPSQAQELAATLPPCELNESQQIRDTLENNAWLIPLESDSKRARTPAVDEVTGKSEALKGLNEAAHRAPASVLSPHNQAFISHFPSRIYTIITLAPRFGLDAHAHHHHTRVRRGAEEVKTGSERVFAVRYFFTQHKPGAIFLPRHPAPLSLKPKKVPLQPKP